jgi:hypothetical protein
MTPPAGSIKAEVNHAVAKGIRRRGPDAVGLVLMGMARLVVAAVTLALLLAISSLSGNDLTALHFAGATAVAAAVNWLLASRTDKKRSSER